MLYNGAFGGVRLKCIAGKLGTWEDTQENVLGSYTPTHFWIFPLVFTLTHACLFLFSSFSSTHVCRHSDTLTVGCTHH